MGAEVAALGGYPADVEIRLQHLHDGLDLDHLGAELVAALAVGFDLPRQLSVELG
jgi:hypothetical protein